MIERSHSHNDCVLPAQDGCGSAEPVWHPAWCDPTRCPADPTSRADGYRSGVGGEHRSAPIPLNLTTAFMLPACEGTAWLTEACAPWRCDAYLRVQIGDLEFSMSAHYAGQMLDDLSALLESAATAGEVTR